MSVMLDVRNVFAGIEDGYKAETEANNTNPSPLVNLRSMVAGGALTAFRNVQQNKRAIWPKGYGTVERQLGREIRLVAPSLIFGLTALKPKHTLADVEKEIDPRIAALKTLQQTAAEKAGAEGVNLSIDVQTQAIEQADKGVQTEKPKTNYWLVAAAAAVGFAAGFFLARRS